MFDFRNKKLFFAFSFGILLFAIVVRFYKLGSIPVSLYVDEVAMLADVRSLLETGRDLHGNNWYQLIFPSYGDYKLPIYIWLSTVSAYFFGPSGFSLRLISALAGVGSVLLVWGLARELYRQMFPDKSSTYLAAVFPLCAMFVASVSPWGILFSRTGFEGHLAQFFLWLSVYLLLLAKRHKVFFIFSLFFAVFSIYTYYSVRFVWPVIFFIILLLQFKRKEALSSLAKFSVGILLVLLCLIPLRNSNYFAASEQFRLSTKSLVSFESFNQVVLESNAKIDLAGNNRISRIVFHRYVLWSKELASSYAKSLSANFLFFTGDSNLRHGTGMHGVFLLPFLPFLFIGFLALFQKKPVFGFAFLTMLAAAILPAAIPTETPHALRSINAFIPLSLVIGFGIASTLQFLQVHFKDKKVVLYSAISAVLLCVLFSLLGFLHYYFFEYPSSSSKSWFICQQNVVREISALDSSTPVLFLDKPYKIFLWFLAFGSDTKGTTIFSKQDLFAASQIDQLYFEATQEDIDATIQQKIIIVKSKLNTIPNLEKNYVVREIGGNVDDCNYFLLETKT